MNTMEMVQSACSAWLAVPDQTAMELSDVSELLRALNLAQNQVWRAQPPHYRRQTISLEFYGPADGTVTVPDGYGTRRLTGITFPTITDILTYNGDPLTYEGEPLVFNGSAVYESPRPFCSILLEGDAVVNEFNGFGLVHPYFGQATTPIQATLFNDACLSRWLIERINGPVLDRINRGQFYYAPTLDFLPDRSFSKVFTTTRVIHAGVERTLFRLPRQHRSVVSLRFDADVAPPPITYGTSQRPADLNYGDEVAFAIIAVAGAALQTHRLFDRARIGSSAPNSASYAMEQIAGLSQVPTSQFVSAGTPYGY